MKLVIKLLLSILLLVGCGGNTKTNEHLNSKKLSNVKSWYWQLQGKLAKHKVDLYDIDLFDTPKDKIASLKAESKLVICYFNAGAWENWRSDANKFNKDDLGSNLDDWEGEKWLNIRSQSVRAIMKQRLDLAKSKGCDGVEPDNVDGYSNDNGLALSYTEQLNFNKFIAKEAKKRGLLVALKNDLDQIKELVDSFDFALNESCNEYNECDKLSPFIKENKLVLNAEYNKRYLKSKNFKELCKKSNALGIKSVVYNLELDGKLYKSCKAK